jgi:RNA polymerase sigma factor (sigma-70 family)
MTFEELLDQAIAMLRRRGRVTYRTLQLQFQLDDAQLEALKEALIEAKRLAVDEDGKVLVWTGGTMTVTMAAADRPHPPLSYTPTHLAETILLSKAALEGERKQVTVLFADLKGSMELLADQGPTVRLPVHVHEQVGRLTRTAHRLEQSLERAPTAEELAHALGRSAAQVHAMQARHTPVLSLDAPLAEGESRLGDVMADEATLPPSEAALIAERTAQIEQCLQALTPREQAIVRARFGLDDGETRTLEELGQGLQLSRERVRQIEARALEKLRHPSRMPRLRGWVNN